MLIILLLLVLFAYMNIIEWNRPRMKMVVNTMDKSYGTYDFENWIELDEKYTNIQYHKNHTITHISNSIYINKKKVYTNSELESFAIARDSLYITTKNGNLYVDENIFVDMVDKLKFRHINGIIHNISGSGNVLCGILNNKHVFLIDTDYTKSWIQLHGDMGTVNVNYCGIITASNGKANVYNNHEVIKAFVQIDGANLSINSNVVMDKHRNVYAIINYKLMRYGHDTEKWQDIDVGNDVLPEKIISLC